MRLQLNIINIKKVQFAGKTAVGKGVLSINREELKELLKEDPRLGEVDIELAQPGEKCRITRVVAAVEPRARLGNGAVDFPGAIGEQGTVGNGSTCVLRGAAVLTSELFTGVRKQSATEQEVITFVDMWGPGAETGPYGKTCNIVILPYPSDGTSLPDYQIAIKLAGLKAAAYLAKAGVALEPDDVEVYDLPPLPETSGDMAKLPRIVYIFMLFSNNQLPVPGDAVLYGDNIERIVPAILHPNEVFDGAITAPYHASHNDMETYTIQNHPVIKDLYRRHGKSLYFAGVIVTSAPNNGPEINKVGNIAGNLAKWTLAADGAVLTKCGGGAPNITLGETGRKCEELGIRTVLIIPGASVDSTAMTLKVSTLFSDVTGVDAMISLGSGTAGGQNLTLPAAEKVIGIDAAKMMGEMVRPATQIKGASHQIGDSKLKIVQY